MKLCKNVNPYQIKLSSKLGHVRLKPRLLDQIIEKPCVHSGGHSCDQKLMKLCLNVNPQISRSNLNLSHVGSKLGCEVKS